MPRNPITGIAGRCCALAGSDQANDMPAATARNSRRCIRSRNEIGLGLVDLRQLNRLAVPPATHVWDNGSRVGGFHSVCREEKPLQELVGSQSQSGDFDVSPCLCNGFNKGERRMRMWRNCWSGEE